MKHTIEALQTQHVSAIYLVAKLIDNNAPQEKINAARTTRDNALKAIRETLPNYDKGYT